MCCDIYKKVKKHQEPYLQLQKKQLCCKKGNQHHAEKMHSFKVGVA